MKSYRDFAWKELKAQKVTSVLILIAIVLSTMMTTAVGQSLGILKALQIQQASALNGIRYATFHNISDIQASKLSSDSRISWAGSNIFLGSSKLQNSGITLSLNEYDSNDIEAYPAIFQTVSGTLPKKAGEIALSENTLKLLGFTGSIGDTVTLDLSVSLLRDNAVPYKYNADFILSGILVDNYLGYSSGLVVGVAGQGSGELLLPEKYLLYSTDFITTSKLDFQNTVEDISKELNISDDYIQYNWVYLNALGIDHDDKNDQSNENSGFTYMAVTGAMIAALVLLAAGLVIYNILKISVSKRIREYGTLRAIGAEKSQLYLLVSVQLILLCGIGIPVGAICGLLCASSITKAATGALSPGIFMTQSTEELTALISQNSTGKLLPLLISAAVTLLFAFVAAMPVAKYAAKVSPTVAMNATTTKVRRKDRKDKSIHQFERFYARLNLKRNAGRTVITILSLVMSITVFVALQAFSGLLDTSKGVQKLHLGDYSITNETVGFAPSDVENIKEQSGIASVFTLKYSLYTQDKSGKLPIDVDFSLYPGETLQIVGVNEERLKLLSSSLSQEDLQNLKIGKACLIKNPIALSYEGQSLATTSFTTGDTIIVENTELNVLGNCDSVELGNSGFVNGVQVIVFDAVYDKLTGKSTYSELNPVLKDGADKQSLERKIKDICDKTVGSYWISYENTDEQLEESYQQIKLLAWGLILFIGIIGLLNIINTVYSNIHTRVTEIGMQRAIGMSADSLYKTFLWEGAYYGIIASVIGGAFGYICTIFVNAATTDKLQLVAIPYLSILGAGAISVLACLLATAIPLRSIAKMNIVEAIETVE